jgi:hypothetical protein
VSEYQYYEFQTVDRRLSEQEMQELRGYSTRARITPTSFINEYHFGSFKGNPNAWMEKYFDGFLYVANWGTRELQVSLPAKLLSAEAADQYCSGRAASNRERAGKLIFTFLLEEEPSGEWLEGEGHLSSLLQLRSELAHGDLRPLYLGWLMNAQAGELHDTGSEPPLPPNLGELSGTQESFAEFFQIDSDLLAVAAQNSAHTKAEPADPAELSSWIASLPVQEKNELLFRLMTGEEARIAMELQSRFQREHDRHQPTARLKPRTVADLLAAAKARREERQKEQERKAALAKESRQRLAELAREKHLESLKGRSETIWANVETLAASRQPKSYDLALQHLIDLRELAERESHQSDFKKRLATFRDKHSAKRSLTDRLARVCM